MKIIDLESRHWEEFEKNGMNRKEVTDFVAECANEAMAVLPFNFAYTNLVIEPVLPEYTIPETGTMGITYSDTYLSLTFDCNLPFGVEKFKKSLRGVIFHELAHVVSFSHDAWQPSPIFGVVTEGLSTIFEREYADSDPLWGKYEEEATMRKWYKELKELPETDEKDRRYFVEHSDGRKWIIYKTGAWMIDKLVKSGRDIFELMKTNHKEILAEFESISKP